jgi:hypothetical protein
MYFKDNNLQFHTTTKYVKINKTEKTKKGTTLFFISKPEAWNVTYHLRNTTQTLHVLRDSTALIRECNLHEELAI